MADPFIPPVVRYARLPHRRISRRPQRLWRNSQASPAVAAAGAQKILARDPRNPPVPLK